MSRLILVQRTGTFVSFECNATLIPQANILKHQSTCYTLEKNSSKELK